MGGNLVLHESGEMVRRWWKELNSKFPHVQTDEFVLMPNHLHGIIELTDAAHRGVQPGDKPGQESQRASIPAIVQWFKTMSTNGYIRGVKHNGWKPFPGRLWQRGYFEHRIRDELDLDRVRQYIVSNPAKWEMDRENPSGRAAGDTGPTRRSAPTGRKTL